MRTPTLLFALALGVRLLIIALYPDPAYADSYYYVDVARAIHATGRLELDFIWIFGEVGGRIPTIPVLPVPSNAHWLPLASFVQVPFLAILGDTGFASALPLALIGALAAPLTWLIAREAGCRPAVQIGAAVLAAIPAAGAVFMGQPDNFAIFQPLVAATLLLTARGLKGHAWSFAIAGLLVGLASLARNDGFLLGAAVGLIFVWDRARSLRSRGRIRPRIPFAAAFGCLGLYLLVMGPWYLRQLAVFGSLSPTVSSGPALYIRSISEWNSITANPSLQTFLAQGIGPIVASRLVGLSAALAQLVVIMSSIVLVPFLGIGAWLRRMSVDFVPWFLYFALLLAGATLIFPLHVPGGAYIHSAVGLEPHAYILALEGVAASVAWIARRRRGWDVGRATSVFVGGIVAFTIVTAALYGLFVIRTWDNVRQPRIALASQLDSLGVKATDRILSIDAAGMKYFTGRGGVVTPGDSIHEVEAVARAYHTGWLVLERTDVAPALVGILEGQPAPSWIGRSVWSLPSPEGGPPRIAIYPVCVDPGDVRCGA